MAGDPYGRPPGSYPDPYGRPSDRYKIILIKKFPVPTGLDIFWLNGVCEILIVLCIGYHVVSGMTLIASEQPFQTVSYTREESKWDGN